MLAASAICATIQFIGQSLQRAPMPRPASDDRLIIRFDLDDSIDLDVLSESFQALSRQYRKMLSARGLSEEDAPTRLLVTRLESGSLETEIAAWGVITWGAIQAMDASLIIPDFATRIRRAVGYFADKNKRPKELERDDVRDFETFIKPLAGRKGSNLSVRTATYHEKTETREIHAEYKFNEKELAGAFVKMGIELEGDDKKLKTKHNMEKNVALYWAQTNWVGFKTKGRTGDRGIIEKISDKPLPVYYPTEEATLKHKMNSGESNPSKNYYIVDVDVQTVKGEPAAYTIMNLHETLPFDGSD